MCLNLIIYKFYKTFVPKLQLKDNISLLHNNQPIPLLENNAKLGVEFKAFLLGEFINAAKVLNYPTSIIFLKYGIILK